MQHWALRIFISSLKGVCKQTSGASGISRKSPVCFFADFHQSAGDCRRFKAIANNQGNIEKIWCVRLVQWHLGSSAEWTHFAVLAITSKLTGKQTIKGGVMKKNKEEYTVFLNHDLGKFTKPSPGKLRHQKKLVPSWILTESTRQRF